MISKHVYKFCSENVSYIENFLEAVNDRFEMWDCHHRLEIQDDKILTREDLLNMGLYWNRPASELIFLRKSEHSKLHSSKSGWNGKNRKLICRGFCRPDIHVGFMRKAKFITPTGEIVEMNVGIVKRYHKDWTELR